MEMLSLVLSGSAWSSCLDNGWLFREFLLQQWLGFVSNKLHLLVNGGSLRIREKLHLIGHWGPNRLGTDFHLLKLWLDTLVLFKGLDWSVVTILNLFEEPSVLEFGNRKWSFVELWWLSLKFCDLNLHLIVFSHFSFDLGFSIDFVLLILSYQGLRSSPHRINLHERSGTALWD